MSLLLATLLPGLFLLFLGVPLLLNNSAWTTMLKRFPRSQRAAYVFFTAGAAWFLYAVWHLSPADFGDYRGYLFVGFALIAILSYKCVPDFLSVRGLSALILMAADPLLTAAYMEYEKPQRLLLVTFVYLCIAVAIWLGAQPWRMRDWLEWLLARPQRLRTFGGLLAAYGLILSVVAFTY